MNANQTLPTPQTDLADLTSMLGQAWGVTSGEPLAQYLAWCETAGVFAVLSRNASVTPEDIAARTPLRPRAADALLCILASLKLVQRSEDGSGILSPLGREYLLKEGPFYIGDALYLKCDKALPEGYLSGGSGNDTRNSPVALLLAPDKRLRVQHSRNFAPSIVASRTGIFGEFHHVVDIAGGSGVFSIPLALDHPHLRITLVELPEVVSSTKEILALYGVEDRVAVIARDIFRDEWDFDKCDCVFIGNFFHCNDDEACRLLCRKSFEALSENGQIWLHEVLLNEGRDGPLIAALWNAIMVARNPKAGQRTASELFRMMKRSGFESLSCRSTIGGFSLLGASKISDLGLPHARKPDRNG
jgi:3-hydroxy-5-methyl-1-naphthoate 3-O-methyltransferase